MKTSTHNHVKSSQSPTPECEHQTVRKRKKDNGKKLVTLATPGGELVAPQRWVIADTSTPNNGQAATSAAQTARAAYPSADGLDA
jgi:hypothetical protein